jgi:hypothetical protein
LIISVTPVLIAKIANIAMIANIERPGLEPTFRDLNVGSIGNVGNLGNVQK